MILLFDVGNSNIVLGISENKKIKATYRFITNSNLTEDEYYQKFKNIIGNEKIDGIAISSVVPQVDNILVTMCQKYFNISPLIVSTELESGMDIKIDNPKQLGADLLCDAVGARNHTTDNTIIVDLGTASKFIVVSKNNEYLGGAIAPGLIKSLESLINSAAKLSNVKMATPYKVIGTDTQTCIQSGMIYGFVSLIDGMIEKIKKELNDENTKIILTGGLSHYVKDLLKEEVEYLPNVLLDGLLTLYYKN